MKKQKQPKFLPLFSNERWVLFFCIGLALIAWFLVKLSEEFIIHKEVKIEYYLPTNRNFVETPPSSIDARVKGSGWNLLSNYLNQEAPIIHFSLPEKSSFTITGTVLKNKVEQALPNLNIEEINYDYILLKMDSLQ